MIPKYFKVVNVSHIVLYQTIFCVKSISQLYRWHVLVILPSFNGAQPWPLSFSPVGPSALPGPFTVEDGRSTFDVNNPIIN